MRYGQCQCYPTHLKDPDMSWLERSTLAQALRAAVVYVVFVSCLRDMLRRVGWRVRQDWADLALPS